MIREAAKRSSKLSRRLAEISRRRAAGEAEPPDRPGGGEDLAGPLPEGGPVCRPVGIEELLPGGVLDGPQGTLFVHERLRSAIERPRPGWGRLRRSRGGTARGRRPGPEWLWADAEEPSWELDAGDGDGHAGEPGEGGSETTGRLVSACPADETRESLAPEVLHRELESLLRVPYERVVFLDLETGGLSNAAVFLAGTMRWNGNDFVLKQCFARHYGEEEALIRHVATLLSEAGALVTFNGKSFDVPFLKERAVRYRTRISFPELHVDLLHHARAAWRGRVPNCRLVTLEAYVCRRRRSGDIPGEEIPGLYHDYVKSGEAHRLIPVFHHNLLDVITMDELLNRLI
jgi:uncharacterized protein YprB with RNaseH-like and TPR domain